MSSVLLVGPSNDLVLEPMRRSLGEAGFTVVSCPAATMADCPSASGGPCLVTEPADSVVVHQATPDYRPPCAEVLDRPGLVVFPRSELLTRFDRRHSRFRQSPPQTNVGAVLTRRLSALEKL